MPLIEGFKTNELTLKLKYYKARVLDRNGELTKALAIYLFVLAEAEKNDFYRTVCETNIWISLVHEKNAAFDLAFIYLSEAKMLAEKYKIQDLYSTILIRMSSIHRMAIRVGMDGQKTKRLSNLGFVANLDTSVSLAKQAIPLAEKNNKLRDLKDAYFLIGAIYRAQKKNDFGLAYTFKTIAIDKKTNDTEALLLNYANIARFYFESKNYKKALLYNDSSISFIAKEHVIINHLPLKQRAEIYNALGNIDSAYYYLNKHLDFLQQSNEMRNATDIKKLEHDYQNINKEETIKAKNQLLLLLISLLTVIIGGAVVLFYKNKQINNQNKLISKHVAEMEKTIEQKQILLSELQHRVKNNLQYVISILEIQKESASHNNINELIRSNQNRIHSLALLHKKLSVNENVNEVDLKKYVSELSELVKDSYKNADNSVGLFIGCTIDILSITKALPVGLIIVELISNSMKHAFRNKSNGIISIELFFDPIKKLNCLQYLDNGEGFNFKEQQQKGIGIEIIKGLIDQLNGSFYSEGKNGFEFKMYF